MELYYFKLCSMTANILSCIRIVFFVCCSNHSILCRLVKSFIFPFNADSMSCIKYRISFKMKTNYEEINIGKMFKWWIGTRCERENQRDWDWTSVQMWDFWPVVTMQSTTVYVLSESNNMIKMANFSSRNKIMCVASFCGMNTWIVWRVPGAIAEKMTWNTIDAVDSIRN